MTDIAISQLGAGVNVVFRCGHTTSWTPSQLAEHVLADKSAEMISDGYISLPELSCEDCRQRHARMLNEALRSKFQSRHTDRHLHVVRDK